MRYDRLRQRLDASGLPWDDEAERAAIGALLAAPREHGLKLSKRAMHTHFYDPAHGWLWARMSWFLGPMEFDFGNELNVYRWWKLERIAEKFGEYYQGSAAAELAKCLNTGFWWHGHWYVDRILEAARARAKIVRATEQLEEALEARSRWWK